MDESLEVKWLERCIESFAHFRFYFLSGRKERYPPISEKLLAQGPVSSYILGRKKKMLWKVGSQADRKLTLKIGEIYLSGFLLRLRLLFLQVALDCV